jgi:hypothetical protein
VTGRQVNIVLGAFVYDDENEDKFAGHGLSQHRVDQVLGNEHVILPNRRGRRGQFLVVGQDDGGSCIAIPIEETYLPDVWRPITAWPCKAAEDAILRRRR